jgi:hypothetical protein
MWFMTFGTAMDVTEYELPTQELAVEKMSSRRMGLSLSVPQVVSPLDVAYAVVITVGLLC